MHSLLSSASSRARSRRAAIAGLLLSLTLSSAALAQPQPAQPKTPAGAPAPKAPKPPSVAYKKEDILKARFSEGDRQQLIQKARTVKEKIGESIIGQERAAQALEDRLVQYLQQYGTRKKHPVALHLIGLPGIGKSDLLSVLSELGFNVLRVDAQQFESDDSSSFYLENLLYNLERESRDKPTIVLFDEIDKLAEISGEDENRDGVAKEKTKPFIGGTLNPLLTDGRVSRRGSGRFYELSNVFVITAMNFAPQEIQAFSEEFLKQKKSYFDFTADDFMRFDEWIRENPGAVAKVLSHLFRINTVSRLAPNTIMVKPLTTDEYRRIIELRLRKEIETHTGGANAGRRIEASFTPELIDYLYPQVVNPPLGARETVLRMDTLAAQLVSFAMRAVGPDGPEGLARPRKVKFDYDKPTDRVVIEITPQKIRGKALVDLNSFRLPVKFEPELRAFAEPEGLADAPPKLPGRKPEAKKEKPPTKKQILQARFPERGDGTKGMAKAIDAAIYGQEEITALLESEAQAFLGRSDQASSNVYFRVLAGFPGIGKSEIPIRIARYLGVPLVRINMQAFVGTEMDVTQKFAQYVRNQIAEAQAKSKNGQYVVLFEELDKVFEIDPQKGFYKERPIMNLIKDLLNGGKAAFADNYGNSIELDIRSALTYVTMNFAVDRFGFSADPRLTTIDDVMGAWRKLATRAADRKAVLQSLFLPETVSRLFDRTLIVKPLDESAHRKVIEFQVQSVAQERLHDPKTGKNLAQVELEITPEYRRYLYNETVIPSEGARNTAVATRRIVGRDLEDALRNLPRSSQLASQPLTVTLHYLEGTTRVVASVRPKAETDRKNAQQIYAKEVALTFPPMGAKGKLSPQRLGVSLHEFGHAFAAIRLGLRFEVAVAVSPREGTGGYVKWRDSSPQGESLLSLIYAGIASRAMERIFFAEDPLSPEAALAVTSGPSSDIVNVTQRLWDFVYQLGFDPETGILERTGAKPFPYANFAPVPDDKVAGLARIVQDMEDHMVREFLGAHPLDWYRDRVVEFARRGALTEKEFYALVGYEYPGEQALHLGVRNRLEQVFKGVIQEPSSGQQQARDSRRGLTATTPAENLERASQAFVESVKRHLHPRTDASDCRSQLHAKPAQPAGEGAGAEEALH